MKRQKRRNKTEISLDKAERTLIRLGLDLIVNRLATAKAGSYPHAHPLARIDPNSAAVYQTRRYNEQFAKRVISLRNRVSPVNRKEQFRLDAFDLAAVSLGLRVTAQKRLWEKASSMDKQRLRKLSDPPDPEIRILLKKLEVARKRAKPTIATPEHQQYVQLDQKWKAFVAWIRYTLLYDEAQCQRIIKRGVGTRGGRRTTAKLRFQALLTAARMVIDERTTAQIPESELLRLVKLARNELQPSRHRHPVSIVDLERNFESAKDFMFDFINKRGWNADGGHCDLYPFLKIEFVPRVLRYSFRQAKLESSKALGEDYAAAPQRENANAAGPSTRSQLRVRGQERVRVEESTLSQSKKFSNERLASNTNLTSRGSDNRTSDSITHAPTTGSGKSLRTNRYPEAEHVAANILDNTHRLVPDGPLSETNDRFNEGAVVSGIVCWLQAEEPEPSHWNQLFNCAMARTGPISWREFRPYPRPTEGLTFDLLLEDCRPGKLDSSKQEKAHILAAWMIEVLRYVYRNPNQVRQVLQKAFSIAK